MNKIPLSQAEPVTCLDISDCKAVSEDGFQNCKCDKVLTNNNPTESRVQQSNTSGIKEAIYPNPFTGEVTFSAEASAAIKIDLNIYNAIGSVVYKQDFDLNKGKNEVQLKLDKLPNGIYFIVLTDNQNNRWTKRIIKQ